MNQTWRWGRIQFATWTNKSHSDSYFLGHFSELGGSDGTPGNGYGDKWFSKRAWYGWFVWGSGDGWGCGGAIHSETTADALKRGRTGKFYGDGRILFNNRSPEH